jgi:hypothetical protein
MERLAAEENMTGNTTQVQGFSATVDRKGTVIFTLPGGGRILDSGKELYFSGNNEAARHVAVQYAQKKWGKKITLDGNKIVRRDTLEKIQVMER